MAQSLLRIKSYNFALKVVGLYEELRMSKEYDLARQLLKSGTSIGANIEEAFGSQSKKEFSSKLSISYKECLETKYWLNLLVDSDKIEANKGEELIQNLTEIAKMLASSRITVMKSL